jgi:hypothetical protein
MSQTNPPALEAADEWVHVETGERIPEGLGALADVSDPDSWTLEWSCRRCGATFVDADPDADDQLVAAGMTSVHVPCATDAELDAADAMEEIVATNARNAEAFGSGAYDK